MVRLVPVVILLLLIVFSPIDIHCDNKKNVLILNSYHFGYTGSDALVESAKRVLTDRIPDIEIYVEYMDTKRVLNDAYLQQYYQLLNTKYEGMVFDAILVSDDNAFQFMLKYHDELFDSSPVVFCGVNNFDPAMLQNAPDFTGVLEALDIRPTIEMALRMHPNAKRMVVISDGTETGLSQRRDIESVAEDRTKFQWEYLNGEELEMGDLIGRLRVLPTNSIVFAAVWTQDKTGEFMSYDEFYPQISRNSKAPVYGFDRLFLDRGIVGGKLNWGGKQGEKAAEIVSLILKQNRPPDSILVYTESLNAWYFDYLQLRRFGIRETQLPEGSIVINRPDSFLRIEKSIFLPIVFFTCVIVLLLLLLILNLNKRWQAERKQYAAEEKYRIFIKNFHGIIYQRRNSIDPPIFFEGNVTRMCGHDALEFSSGNLRWRDLIHPDDTVCIDKECERMKTDRGDIANCEYRIKHKDGSYRWINDVGQYFLEESEESPVVQGILYDISERKALEEQLLQSQKMEAIGKLAGGVAHDFNNVLMAILGYTDFILNEEDIRDSALEIKKAAEHAETLTRQLLAFSRKQILQPQVIHLNELLQVTKKMLHRLIGEDIELSMVLEKELKNIFCDRGQIEQVIINLAINSRDAMPDGGRLTLETKNVFLDREYAFNQEEIESGDYVMLSVSDNGRGMTQEVRERIFEPFYSTKELGKGTGLGLSTVHGIVRQSHGHIWVYSEPDRGTSFKIYFPCIDGNIESTVQKQLSPDELKGDETILLVEDEESVRKLVSNVLLNHGYTVLLAGTGREGLGIARKYNRPIDLLITDVVMPEMNGRSMADLLLKKDPQLRVLFMSGYTDNAIIHHGVLEEGLNFIQKPFDTTSLLIKIREIFDS